VSDPQDGSHVMLYTSCVKRVLVCVINELFSQDAGDDKQCQNYKPDLQVTTVHRAAKSSRAGLVQCSCSAM
jgi:hypothetical protein